MRTTRPARRRQLAAALAGLCLAAGSLGNAALASRGTGSGDHGSRSGSGSSTTVSVEASVLVQAGLSPFNAAQAAAVLNSAIDSATQTIVRAAIAAVPSRAQVRSTAVATRAFAKDVDAALTEFVIRSVGGLRTAGTSAASLVNGTVAALNQMVRTVPGAVTVVTGAEVSVAGGADGTSVSASLNPTLQTALRQTISDSVRAVRPVLPLSRTTVRAVATGVRQVIDASVVAVNRIVRVTVDLATAGVTVSAATLQAARAVAESAVAALGTVVAAVDTTLDTLSDVNLTAAVDASLSVSAG